jgi:hypothetical protein
MRVTGNIPFNRLLHSLHDAPLMRPGILGDRLIRDEDSPDALVGIGRMSCVRTPALITIASAGTW